MSPLAVSSEIHTIGFRSSVASSSMSAIAPIADNYLLIESSKFRIAKRFQIGAAYMGAAGAEAARLDAPSLHVMGNVYFRPVQPATDGKPPHDPALAVMLDQPMLVTEADTLSLLAKKSGAGAENMVGLVWLVDEIRFLPEGDSFVLRFTATGTATAWAWTSLTMAWDVQPPAGTYAILGFEFRSDNAIAARLALPGRVTRPGVLALSSATGLTRRTAEIFYDGRLGVLGTFKTTDLPKIELLASAADASGFEGYMRLVYLGGLELQLPDEE